MCGIVGYIGRRDAYPVLIKALRRLECRWDDSAGVALIDKKRRLNVCKTKGKVSYLETFIFQKDVPVTIGIAHTRWATHRKPFQANIHPCFFSSEDLALIHNGIIENYIALQKKLQEKGVIFNSSANTEVFIQLIEYFQSFNHLDLLTVVQLALHKLIAVVIPVLTEGDALISKPAGDCAKQFGTLKCLESLITTMLLQSLAYHVAVCKGKEVDQSGNPARLVTRAEKNS